MAATNANPLAVVKQLDFTNTNSKDAVPEELKPVQQASSVFGDVLSRARDQPSQETFKEAFKKIVEVTDERFQRIRSCGANAAASGTGEGALRSMRDQFRSLKGSFVSLDTKEAFIDALLAGRPDGTESSLLTQAQSATSQSADELRKSKKRKEELAEEIKEAIRLLCEEYEEFSEVKEALQVQLGKLDESMAGYDRAFEEYTHYSNKNKLPKEKLRQSISDAKSLEAEKEQRKARQESEVQEAEAEMQALEERIKSTKSKLVEYESAESKSDVQNLEEKRLMESKKWFESQIQTISKVSGLTILDVSDSEIHISMKTEPDSSVYQASKFEGCKSLEEDLETVEHEICIGIDSTTQTVSSLTITPSNVPCDDLLENFKGSDYIPALVHSTIARIASYTVRAAYLKNFKEADVHTRTLENMDIACKKSYASGTTIELILPFNWPESGSKLALQVAGGGENFGALVDEFKASTVANGSLSSAINHLDQKLSS